MGDRNIRAREFLYNDTTSGQHSSLFNTDEMKGKEYNLLSDNSAYRIKNRKEKYCSILRRFNEIKEIERMNFKSLWQPNRIIPSIRVLRRYFLFGPRTIHFLIIIQSIDDIAI